MLFGIGEIEIENAGKETVLSPSETLMRMFVKELPEAESAVPDKRRVKLLNVAHQGRFEIEKVRSSPSGSLAEGVKLYVWPFVTWAGGLPLIDGARFGMIGVSDSSPWIGLPVCLVCSALVLAICWAMLRSGYRLKA